MLPSTCNTIPLKTNEHDSLEFILEWRRNIWCLVTIGALHNCILEEAKATKTLFLKIKRSMPQKMLAQQWNRFRTYNNNKNRFCITFFAIALCSTRCCCCCYSNVTFLFQSHFTMGSVYLVSQIGFSRSEILLQFFQSFSSLRCNQVTCVLIRNYKYGTHSLVCNARISHVRENLT